MEMASREAGPSHQSDAHSTSTEPSLHWAGHWGDKGTRQVLVSIGTKSGEGIQQAREQVQALLVPQGKRKKRGSHARDA